jgi:leader peptidase (prepilin peptidase) / N-methyltransferase
MDYIFILVFGLVFGSFIAAYSFRFPRKIKISDGNSFCDNCKRKIMWYENIPLFSYLFLMGRCLKCHKRISIRYPIIESSTSVIFLVCYKYFAFNIFSAGVNQIFVFLVTLSVVLILLMIFIIDLENQIIPDEFVFWGIFIVFVYRLFTGADLFPYLASGLIMSAFLILIFLITKGRGMGLGDAKFVVLSGLIVGLKNGFVYMLLAFLTGAIVGIILILARTARLKDKIAFGPFLIIAIPLTLVWGEKFLSLFGSGLYK